MQRLICQDNAYHKLDRLWAGGHIGHALLIEGAAGSGKRTLAMYAAQMLLCHSSGVCPCGVCSACRKVESGSHPDLTVFDGSDKETYKVDNIREMVKRAYVAPNEGERSVVLMTEAQNMSVIAQNALLKILEEPPAHLCFLMTATSRSALLETVISRVKIITLEELSPEQRLEVLRKISPDTDRKQLRQAADAFETVGQALAAFSDERTQAMLAAVGALYDAIFSRDRYRMLCVLSAWESDRESYCELLLLLRTACIRRFTAEDSTFSALQCSRIVAIIEKTYSRALQNVGRAMLSVVLADGLIASLTPGA